MERCAVVAELPKESDLRARGANNNIDILAATGLAVWRLDAGNRELDMRTLSYSTMPKRLARIGSLDMDLGKRHMTGVFDCKERELLTFEIACTNPSCLVRFTQDKDKPLVGTSPAPETLQS